MRNKKRTEYSEEIVVDPFGSYTGIAVDPLETPVQDADDL